MLKYPITAGWIIKCRILTIGILFSNKRKMIISYYNTDEAHEHYYKQKKLNTSSLFMYIL